MKYVVVLSDGMAGYPLDVLGGKTTMEAARTPMMDELAKDSEIGMVSMVPDGMAPGSDTANLAVMGYDPKQYYTGRSPLEALSIGVEMEDTGVSFRCNLVTLTEEEGDYEDRTILDHSSDEISTEEAAALLKALEDGLEQRGLLKDSDAFYVGTSYRHLLVQKHGEVTELTPPHDILEKVIGSYLPEDRRLLEMMKASYEIINRHPVNEARRAKGLRPANSAWFWGAGKKPSLTSFEERTGKKGVMISAVDLLKGIAVGAGLKPILVEGANGGLHTNYEGKAEAAVDALTKSGYDFAYIHVEAPDEMGHQGSMRDKIAAIEQIDQKVVRTVVEGLGNEEEDFRILILPDHPTPIEMRTHTGDAVPYLLYDSRIKRNGEEAYNEKTAKNTKREWQDGYKLMGHFLQEELC